MSLVENHALGRFAPGAFYNYVLPYRVSYREPEKQRILGPGWRLDNFVPVKKSRSRTVLELDRDDHPTQVVLLDDGDELARRHVNRQDLRFVHPASGATLWLSIAPLTHRLAQQSLFELSARHVQAIEEQGFPTAAVGAEHVERPLKSRVLSQRDARVDGLKAFETTFELSAPESGAPARYVRLVVLRAPFEWPIRGERFRTLMVLGLAATREHFPAHVAELERFVNQVEVDYDDALRARTRKALACTEPSREVAEVELEVGPRGQITRIEPRAPWFDAAEPPGYQSEQMQAVKKARRDAAKACLGSALEGVRLVATGEERELRVWFDARVQAGVRVPGRYETGPFTGDVIAPPSPAPRQASAPASPEPVPAEAGEGAASAASAAPAAPQDEPEAHAALRAQLDARASGLRACLGGKQVALEVTFGSGGLRVELGDPLRGSPEQACVRQVLRDLTAPAGEGRVIHVLASDR